VLKVEIKYLEISIGLSTVVKDIFLDFLGRSTINPVTQVSNEPLPVVCEMKSEEFPMSIQG